MKGQHGRHHDGQGSGAGACGRAVDDPLELEEPGEHDGGHAEQKGESAAAATRSRPSSRPALIVAPDRDTPRDERQGLRDADEGAVAPGQRRDAAPAGGGRVCRVQDEREDDEDHADEHEVTGTGLDLILEEQAEDGDGNRAQPDHPAQPRVELAAQGGVGEAARPRPRRSARGPRGSRRRPRPSSPSWTTAVNAAPGSGQPRTAGTMRRCRRRGDRQELGQPLDDAQDDGVQAATRRAGWWPVVSVP